MATPHVAGVMALYLSGVQESSPAATKEWLKSVASKDKVTDPGAGSPNLLLYSPSN